MAIVALIVAATSASPCPSAESIPREVDPANVDRLPAELEALLRQLDPTAADSAK
jgi:hypothetical protein